MNGDASKATPPSRLVTFEEHEQGWKDHELEFRSGRRLAVRLHGIYPERASALGAAVFTQGQPFALLMAECLIDPSMATDDLRAEWLEKIGPHGRRLTPGCYNLVADLCIALTFGEDIQKKMVELVRLQERAARTLRQSTSPVPASPASAPVSAPMPSAAGACPG